MTDFLAVAVSPVGLWFLGAAILGLVLGFGVLRAGWLKPGERARLDANTRARQRSEDPQKSPQ